jgi:hypothetical protein
VYVLARERWGKTLNMKLIINAREFIRNREPLILSFLIHLLICIIFIHTIYFLPNQKIEDANAAFLILDEGDDDSSLKYQDKSLVDRITMKKNEFPHPEIKHVPILPEVNFRKGTNITDELKYITVDTADRGNFIPSAANQPIYVGKEQFDGGVAKNIKRMRKKGLDICFVFDSTDSMGNFLKNVKIKISSLSATIKTLVPAARIGLVTYRDTGMHDPGLGFATRALQLSYGTRLLKGFLEEIEPEGGGDVKEAVDEGLSVAINGLNWKKKSVKIILLIGDAPPHQEKMTRSCKLVSKFREKMGGTVATLDTNRPALMEGQWGDCPPGVPVPCDLIVNEFLMDEFQLLADLGGGQCSRLDNMDEMNRMIVMLIFGSDWAEYMDAFSRNT